MAQGKGGSGFLILVLLVLVGGAGGWNYKRNLDLEAREHRPFKGYADQDLEALESAYRSEIEQYRERWQQARGHRASAADTGLVGERAREFERVQANSAVTRGLKRELADRQAFVAQIDREQKLREGERDKLKLHLRRLLSV